MSSAAATGSADLFIEVFTAAGIMFDHSMSPTDDFSHSYRIRALRPRIMKAYQGLSLEARLAASNAAINRLIVIGKRLAKPIAGTDQIEIVSALNKIGWGYGENGLVAVDPKVSEMFFPKGSQWDSYKALVAEIKAASSDLVVVDPYCDETIFELLKSAGGPPLSVRLLVGKKKGAALKAEAGVFTKQFSQYKIEIRTCQDFHDRFLIMDNTECVHIGASINHAGEKAFMIRRLESESVRKAVIGAIEEAWKSGSLI